MGEQDKEPEDVRGRGGAGGWLKRCWVRFWRPAPFALGTLLIAGFVVGILFWGGFNWSLELTNTETFCISCHEMEENVFAEYRRTIHYSNASGVRASCPDCHVPREWHHKIVRKTMATNELFHHLMGTVSTSQKFDDKRLELAMNEWRRMKETDSRECRNCHKFDFMDYSAQEPRAARFHQDALSAGETCIDCHRGIAHTLPPNANEAYEQVVESMEQETKGAMTDYIESADARESRGAVQ